ncbi:conserved hypothetical protein [uncultured Paludibacter sp.]|nr:conserved hypothetical protein [uncultured Paludibacter sp.]
MNVTGNITGIKYKIFLTENLKEINLDVFDINTVPAACIIVNGQSKYAISKWVSPKRTRSYPFERVYNSLSSSKRITVIPIVKDEGEVGDRDFLQWDTVSLMSLLDVYVIFAYYDKASVRNKKITKQQFNNDYIISKIKEIEEYHSSALHWNLNELNTNLHLLIEKVKISYSFIEKTTGIKLHNSKGIDNFKSNIGDDVSHFMEFSREKAKQAQSREYVTHQPKESLLTLSKAKITILNYLGGKYFLTVDEILIEGQNIKLIEGKHSQNGLLPSKGDIKDGLLKMILYSNLCNVFFNEKTINSQAVLSLTSTKIKKNFSSENSDKEINLFITENNFSPRQKNIIEIIIKEARENNFIVKVQYSK